MPDDSRDGRDAPPDTAARDFEASFGVGPTAEPASTDIPDLDAIAVEEEPAPRPSAVPPRPPAAAYAPRAPSPAPVAPPAPTVPIAPVAPADAAPAAPVPTPAPAAPRVATPINHDVPVTLRAPVAEPFETPAPAEDTTEIVEPLPLPDAPAPASTRTPARTPAEGRSSWPKKAKVITGVLAAIFLGIVGAKYGPQYLSKKNPPTAAKPSMLEKIASSQPTISPTKSVAYATASDGGVKYLGDAAAKAIAVKEIKVPGPHSTSYEKAEYERLKRQGAYVAKPSTKVPAAAPAKPRYAALQPAEKEKKTSKYAQAHKKKKVGKKTKYTPLERIARTKTDRPTYRDRAYFSRGRQDREYQPQRRDYDDSSIPHVPAYDTRSIQRPKIW